jgi:hypothetical protein
MLVYEPHPAGQVRLQAHALLIEDGHVHVVASPGQLPTDVLLLHVKYSCYF